MRAAREAGERLALKIVASDLRSEREIEEVVAAMVDTADGGLVVLPDIFNASHRTTIIVRAGKLGVPAIYPARFYSVGGGLMSYGPNLAEQYRDVARYIDRILRGTKPADLPVQFASRFELVINLKIAKTMGLPVPPQLLARADEVIE
jgi:putative ABC transport system substrate-binding protein